MRWLVTLRMAFVMLTCLGLAFAMFATVGFAVALWLLRMGLSEVGNDLGQLHHLMGQPFDLRVHVTMTCCGTGRRTGTIRVLVVAKVLFALTAMLLEAAVVTLAFTALAMMTLFTSIRPRRSVMTETTVAMFAFFAVAGAPKRMFAVCRPFVVVLAVLAFICPRRAVILGGAFFMVSKTFTMMLARSLGATVLRTMHRGHRAGAVLKMICDGIESSEAKLLDGFLQVFGLFWRKSGRVLWLVTGMLLCHMFLHGLDMLLDLVGLFVFASLAQLLDVLLRMFEHLCGRHHSALTMLATVLMRCRCRWRCGRVLGGCWLFWRLRSQRDWYGQREQHCCERSQWFHGKLKRHPRRVVARKVVGSVFTPDLYIKAAKLLKWPVRCEDTCTMLRTKAGSREWRGCSPP